MCVNGHKNPGGTEQQAFIGKVAIQESVTKIKLLLPPGRILPEEEWQRSGIGLAIAF